jgi:hypothetical protein
MHCECICRLFALMGMVAILVLASCYESEKLRMRRVVLLQEVILLNKTCQRPCRFLKLSQHGFLLIRGLVASTL